MNVLHRTCQCMTLNSLYFSKPFPPFPNDTLWGRQRLHQCRVHKCK